MALRPLACTHPAAAAAPARLQPAPRAMAAAAAAGQVDAETFRRLYPHDYLRKFVEQGLRPDGRPLAAARPTSIGLGAVSTADARWAGWCRRVLLSGQDVCRQARR